MKQGPIAYHQQTRACLKNHFRNLQAPLCGIFYPHSVAVARYAALSRIKSPTNWDCSSRKAFFKHALTQRFTTSNQPENESGVSGTVRGTFCGRLGQALRSGAYAGFREGQPILVNIAEVSDYSKLPCPRPPSDPPTPDSFFGVPLTNNFRHPYNL